MSSTLILLIRAIQFADGQFYLKLNVPQDEKIKYKDVATLLTEIENMSGEIVSSSFMYDPSIGVKSNVFLAYVSFPVSEENIQKIQTYTFKTLKLN